MKRSLRRASMWLLIFSVFIGLIPGTLLTSSADATNQPVWPNPGAVNLTKVAEPIPGALGQWKVTLTVEGKNIQTNTSTDVVLVIDRSASMKDSSRMTNAITAANKFVDNLLIKDSTTKIAVVSFSDDVTTVSEFKGTSGKGDLKKDIDKIKASGGTNIQAGLHRADTLLAGSQAQNKVIVLLSDGAPTYSYKAGKATTYTWPGDKKAGFALSNFNYGTVLGSGSNYNLAEGYKWFGQWYDREIYTVNGHEVNNNGIATISEAKLIKDKGIGIYSIGLDVGNDNNAKDVLNKSQNKGYLASTSNELNNVFTELSSKISFAAENAKVIDPMGAKFDKIGDVTVSQGTTKWNSGSETIDWDIGNIAEGSPATMSYIVKMDANADPNILYPTNKATILNYTDVNKKSASKEFDVPEVSFGKGSITVRGYYVNAQGDPINTAGVVVDRPDLAEQLYDEPFTVSGKSALDINGTYSVPAKVVDGYSLKKGDNPTSMKLTTSAPNPTIWFGYVKAPYNLNVEYKAGDNVLSPAEVVKKLQGESVDSDYSNKVIPGYTFKNVTLSTGSGLIVNSGRVTGTMPNKEVTITVNYTANAQAVTVKYLEEGTNKVLKVATTTAGVTGETVTLTAAPIPGYTAKLASHSYTFKATPSQEHIFYYTAGAQVVTVKYLEEGTDKVLEAAITKAGVTGGTVTLTAATIAGYTAKALSHSYTFTATPGQEHIFYYTADEQTVTVKYLEKDTNKELATAITKSGVTGKELLLTAATIAGYTAEKTSNSYTFTATPVQEYIFYYTAGAQSVTVKYLEKGTNKELSAATTTAGVTGKIVTLTAATIAGYTSEKVSDGYTFTATAGQEYIFYYTAGTQTVTVKYLEEGTNKVLDDATTIAGETGKTVTLTAATIPGYTAKAASHSYTFKATPGQEHIFYYTANEQTVTVKYLEEGTGKVLEAAITKTGVTGGTATLTAATIAGYTAKAANHSYTFTANEVQEHIFYYTANEQTVTVKYLEEGTDKALEAAITKTGETGKTVTLTAATIAGYTAKAESHSYTFKATPDQEHIFYYTADEQTVTVKYLEEGTNKVLEAATAEEGVTGETVTLTAATVTGYTAGALSHSYTFTAIPGQEHIFYYTADEQTVTVKYLEEGTDKQLADATTKAGVTGGNVTLAAATIPGYTAKEASHSYIFTATPVQEHIFYYSADQQTVTVKYLERGTDEELSAATAEAGVLGGIVTLTAATVTGYTAEAPSHSYTFTANEVQEHIFYYTADEQTVTVKYLEEGTDKELADATTKAGVTGENVTLAAATVTGYTAEALSHSYTFTATKVQEYIFYYTKDTPIIKEGYVTVNYVLEGTETVLKDSTTHSGNVGEVLPLHAEPIISSDGSVYTPVNPDFDYLIKDTEGQQHTFYYTKNAPIIEERDVTVNYVDQLTKQPLVDPVVISGKVGDILPLHAELITVSDAVYTPTIVNFDYVITDALEQQYTFEYMTDDVEDIQQLIVRYLDKETNVELGQQTVTGIAGTIVTLTAGAVQGYTPEKSTDVYEFGDAEGQEYIFYYVKNTPVTPPVNPNPNPDTSTPGPSGITPLPPAPPVVKPLPPAPPRLEMDDHFNYINGYPDGTIKPENRISREEVAVIFYRLMDDATRSDYLKKISSYGDVESSRWSNKHIATMENAGIITGYQDGTFKPGQQITRAEFAAIASRFDNLNEQENTLFSDIKDHWAAKYIVSAANKGWIKGYPDGQFKPNQYITRAEAMAFINSVLNRKVTVDGIHEDAKAWPDNTTDKWYYTDVLEATNYHDYSRIKDGSETWDQVNPDRVYP
ncbi:MucBP domain-containing protein [Paenibacillus sp. FA6]|uniref:MucBP domain-containing protein n=1 Tax=Paenibacillus sp. FA6 TaxID=3413029 RepID=UPI003F6591FA